MPLVNSNFGVFFFKLRSFFQNILNLGKELVSQKYGKYNNENRIIDSYNDDNKANVVYSLHEHVIESRGRQVVSIGKAAAPGVAGHARGLVEYSPRAHHGRKWIKASARRNCSSR